MDIYPTMGFFSSLNDFFVFLLACFVGAFVFYYLQRAWRRLLLSWRFKKGKKAEAFAEKLLKQKGYKILAFQEEGEGKLFVDGKVHSYRLRPDFFVKRQGLVYLVEVKSGEKASSPLYSHTRRQLFEYYYTFPVDGLILLNADTGLLHHIAFSCQEKKMQASLPSMTIAFFLGAVLMGFFYHYYLQ